MGGFNSIQDIDRYLQGGQKQNAKPGPTSGLTPPPAGETHPAPPEPGQAPRFHSITDVDRFLQLNTQAQQPKQPEWQRKGEYPPAVELPMKGINWVLEKDDAIKNWAVGKVQAQMDKVYQNRKAADLDRQARDIFRLAHGGRMPNPQELSAERQRIEKHLDFAYGLERRLAGFATGIVADPLNAPFFFMGGPEVRPALRLGVDALFAVQQGVGATQDLGAAYKAGKALHWQVFKETPAAADFWAKLGSMGINTVFASWGAKDLKHQVATLRAWGEFKEASQGLFGKDWNDLTTAQKQNVMHDIQRRSPDRFYVLDPKGHPRGEFETQAQAEAVAAKNPGWKVDKDSNRMHRIAALGRQFGFQPGAADFNEAEAQYHSATAEQRRQMEEDYHQQREAVVRQQAGLEKVAKQVQQVDDLIANAPEKTHRENQFEPPPVLEGLTPEERQQRKYSLEGWREKIDQEKRQARLEADAERKRREYARAKLSAQLEKLGEAAQEHAATPEFVVSDRRQIAHDPEAAQQAYDFMTAEMDAVAQAHMYENADDMLRSLRTRRIPGTPSSGRGLTETEQAFLDLDRERQRVLQVGRGPLRGLSAEEKAEHVAHAIQLVERETTMREAAAALDRERQDAGNPEAAAQLAAERDEAQEMAEQARTAHDQLEAKKVAAEAPEATYPLGAPMEEIRGKSGSIILADKRELPFHYAVVPLKQLITSHNPLRSFEANENYPEPLQPRDYKNNKETQANVQADSGPERFKPSLLISDDATAHGGPAVVRSDGVVAGGNGRTMRAVLAYKTAAGDELYNLLKEKAPQFGLDPAQLPGREQEPILVRVLDSEPVGAEELALLGRDLNRPLTMGYNQAEEAVLAGKALDPEVMTWINDKLAGMEDTASVRDLMRLYGNDIVAKMVASGMVDPSKRAEYVTQDGEMTEKAKDLFENAVWGKIIDDPELLATTPKGLLRKLDRSLAALFRIRSAQADWDIIPEFQDALRLWKRIDSVADDLTNIGSKSDSQVDKYLRPESLPGGTGMLGFGGQQVRELPHPEVEALAKLLEKNSLEIKRSLADYAADAEGTQLSLMARPEPVESFNRAIAEKVGMEVPPELWGVEQPAAVQTSEAAAETSATKGGTEESPERTPPQAVTPPPAEVRPEAPPVDTAKAVQQLDSAVTTREQLEGVLASHPGIGPEMAKTLTDAMDIVAKNATGKSLDEFVKAHYAGLRTEGEAGLGALYQTDPATYHGKAFWSGAVDPRDGAIVETHTREQAEAAGHHHFLYFDPETAAAISNGELRFFFIGKDARPHVVDPWQVRIGTEKGASPETQKLERDIEKQIKLKSLKAAQGQRGAAEFLEDGRALVHLYQTANASTFLHEFLHTLVPYLKDDDLAVLAKELKTTPELLKKTAPTAEERPAWRGAQEKLASWWERYHRDAVAPTPEVKGIFAKLHQAMRQIYQSIKGSGLAKPSKAVSQLFDSWYGKHPEEAAAEEVKPESKKEAKPKAAKITPPPAPEPRPVEETLGEPSLTKAERATARRIATGGEALTRKDAPVSRVFPDQESAFEWAKNNRDRIKSLEVYETRDGKIYADFVPKDKNALFQEESIPDLNRRIQQLESQLRGRLPEVERYRVGQALTALEKKKAQILSQTSLFARPELTPPPGHETVLWTPEGESHVQKESKPAAGGGPPDEAAGRENVGRPGERVEPARPAPEPRLAGTRPAVRPGGETGKAGARPAGSAVALPAVPATRLDAPERPRGVAVYPQAEWAAKVENLRLPPNAPIPTVKIPDSLRRMLVYSQPEIVESILSGLRQHDAYILATATGTGKTFSGSAVLSQLTQPHDFNLVVVPSQTLIHGEAGWVSVGRDFGLNIHPYPDGRELPTEPGTYVITWAKAREMENLKGFKWANVVLDETQEARGWYRGTKNGELSRSLGANSGKLLYMSATPFHTPLEIGHMEKLGLWKQMGFDPWAAQFGITIDPQTGQYRGTAAFRKLAKLREQLIERGQYLNVDRDMHGYQSFIGIVPMTEETRQGVGNIAKAFDMAESYYRQKRNWGMVKNVRGLAMNYMKAYLERQRLPQAIELGKKLEREGWKVIFFTETKAEVNDMWKPLVRPDEEAFHGQIRRLLPPLPAVFEELQQAFGAENIANFSGPHSPQREAEKEAFLFNDKKHIYATYGAGGVGVSLHDTQGDSPRAVVYIGPPWSGMSFDQALGRPWRYGTKSNVNAHILISDSKPDVRLILQKVAPRLESLRAMVSGIDQGDAMTKAMRDVENALAFEFGNEDESKLAEFTQKVDKAPIKHWTEIPVESAEGAKGKGMKPPGEAAHPAVVKLFQNEYEPPSERADEGEAYNWSNEAKDRLSKGGVPDVPGASDPEVRQAIAEMSPLDRHEFAEDTHNYAQAESMGGGSTPQAEAQSAWRRQLQALKALRAKQEPPAGAPGGPPGLPPEPPPLKMRHVFFRSGFETMRVMGGNAGIEIADGMFPDYLTEWSVVRGKYGARAWDLWEKYGYSRRQQLDVIDAHEGKREPKDERERQFVSELRDLFADVLHELQAHGVEVKTLDGRYFSYRGMSEDPHFWPRQYAYNKLREIRDREHILRSIEKEQGLTRAQAQKFLEEHGGRRYPLAGHIEKTREADVEGYDKSFAAIARYVDEVGEAIGRTKAFGQRREKLDAKLLEIPGANNRKVVEHIVDQALVPMHMYPEVGKFNRFASNLVMAVKMPFSMIPALSGAFRAGLYADITSMLKGILRSAFDHPAAYHAALESGAIWQGAMDKYYEEMGLRRGFGRKMLRLYGFTGTHLLDRLIADQTARIYIEKQILPRLLKGKDVVRWRQALKTHYGLTDVLINDAIQNRQWSDEAYNRAAARHADETQHTYMPAEAPPVFSHTPEQDPVSQHINTFAHTILMLNQTAARNGALMKRAILEDLKSKRPGNMAVVLASIIGSDLLMDLYDMVARGDPTRILELGHGSYYTPEHLALRALDDLTFHASMGMIQVLIRPLRYNLSPGRFFQSLMGPFYGTLADSMYLFYNELHAKAGPHGYPSVWHRRWMQTWHFLTRTYGPLRMAQTAMGGPPSETPQEKRRRESQERKRRAEEMGPPPAPEPEGTSLNY